MERRLLRLENEMRLTLNCNEAHRKVTISCIQLAMNHSKMRQTSQEEHERHRSASYTQATSMISSLDSWQFDKTRPKIYVLLRVWFNSFNPLLLPWLSGPFGTCRLQMPSRAHEDFLGHWADQTNYHLLPGTWYWVVPTRSELKKRLCSHGFP